MKSPYVPANVGAAALAPTPNRRRPARPFPDGCASVLRLATRPRKSPLPLRRFSPGACGSILLVQIDLLPRLNMAARPASPPPQRPLPKNTTAPGSGHTPHYPTGVRRPLTLPASLRAKLLEPSSLLSSLHSLLVSVPSKNRLITGAFVLHTHSRPARQWKSGAGHNVGQPGRRKRCGSRCAATRR